MNSNRHVNNNNLIGCILVTYRPVCAFLVDTSEITLVKIVSKNAKEPPTIKFFCKPLRHLVYKEFPVYNFSKRKSILLYLKAKGINIEIESVNNRDIQILKDDFSFRVSNKD